MKLGFLLFVLGYFLQLNGAAVPVKNGVASFTDCTLQPKPTSDLQRSFILGTGGLTLFGLPEKNSFLRGDLISVLPDGTVNLAFNPALLNFGENKAYIGFFVPNASQFAGFVTIDVSCTPQSTISLAQDTLSQQVNAGSNPASFTLPKVILGANGLSYAKNPIQFTMTPDPGNTTSPWITSASVPGFPPNTGSVTSTNPADLTVNINPTGLAAQADPYLGFVHIRDNTTGFGSADLTVNLTVNAAATGNVTLPHFAANGPYVSGFYVVNTGGQPASFSISFYDDTGKSISLPVQGRGTVPAISGALQANSSAYFEAGDPNLPLVGGSAHVIADSSIGVQGLFRLHLQNSDGNRYYEAAVPASVGSKEFVLPFDFTTFAPTGEQVFTGIAIANLDPALIASVTCTARDSSGNVIPNAIRVPDLAVNGHWADFNFAPLTGLRGSIDCIGTANIGAIALHAFAKGAISSLPVLQK